MNIPNGLSQPQVAIKSGPAAARSFGRAANWTVGGAAAALVLISVGGYFYHREHLSAIAAEHLRLIVTGPSTLQAGVAAEYLVSATSIGGQPLPAEIEVALLAPDGKRLKAYKEPADDRGCLRVVVPADLRFPPQIKLRVVAWHRESREEAEMPLWCKPARCVTHLILDRTRYWPGDLVRYRSLTLSGLSLAAGREMPVYFEALGPDGMVVPNSQTTCTTQHGVGSGAFKVPDGFSPGQYAMVVRSPDGTFPEQKRLFLVVRPAALGDAPDGPDEPKIAKPDGAENRPELPAVVAERDVAITAGKGVFAAEEPLEFNIRAAKAGLPLIAAAYCRGAQVGQQPLVTKAGAAGANPVAIVPDAAASGAIRLCVYDYTAAPPKAVAERMVYRRPARRLNVLATGQKERYAPGEKVDMSLLVADESGKPVSAALGVAVVDEASLSSGGDCSPAMSTQFLLTGEIERSDGLGDADFYLSDQTKDNVPAAVALDLLLGAQPAASDCRPSPPAMFDNVGRIRANYEKTLSDYQADRTGALNTLTTASFFGGMGLVLLVAMLGLMRIVSGIHLWVAAVGATTCCLIVGAILMDPGRLPTGQEPIVPFATYHAPSANADEPSDRQPAPAATLSGRNEPVGQEGATLFWDPLLMTDAEGKAAFQFQLPKVAGAFRVSIDAHGAGRIGSGRAEIVVGAPEAADPPPKSP